MVTPFWRGLAVVAARPGEAARENTTPAGDRPYNSQKRRLGLMPYAGAQDLNASLGGPPYRDVEDDATSGRPRRRAFT